MNNQGIPIPPPPGSQFTPVPVPRPFVPLSVPPSVMPMMHPPPLPQGVPPPPPPEEAPPPLPEEPEPKRQKLDDSALIPEDQFLAQHPVWTNLVNNHYFVKCIYSIIFIVSAIFVHPNWHFCFHDCRGLFASVYLFLMLMKEISRDKFWKLQCNLCLKLLVV